MATHANPENPAPEADDLIAEPLDVADVGLLPLPRQVGEATISSKNQISLPAEGVRQLGWEKGDRVRVEIDGDRMVLWRQPASLADYWAGSLTDVFGDHERTLRFLDEERRSWRAWQQRHGV